MIRTSHVSPYLLFLLFFAAPLRGTYDTMVTQRQGSLLRFGFDTRFHAGIFFEEKYRPRLVGNGSWHADAYIMIPYDFFIKGGVSIEFSRESQAIIPLQRRTFNAQIGSYWHPYGAVRFGVVESGVGGGIDYWLVYGKIRWLTTVEVSFPVDRFDRDFYKRVSFDDKPHITWLNRIFLTQSLYAGWGINHYCDTSWFATVGVWF